MVWLTPLVVFLAAIASAVTVDGKKVDTHIQWIDCAQNVPLPLQQQFNVTTWNDTNLPALPTTLKCGRLSVPLDHSYPISLNNTISLGFAMYRPKGAKTLLNFNPGGPGVEVASYAWLIALNQTVPSYFAGFLDQDFLAMDTRGFWQSNPLNCSIEAALGIPLAFPSNETEFFEYQAIVANFAQTCINQTTPVGIVEHVGTQETIQDWDMLRSALGYKKMNFMGISYGTYSGAEYASRFPERVDRFVLDAVTPHGMPLEELAPGQVTAVNRLLLRADAYCLYDKSCPFHTEGKGAIPTAFASVVKMAQEGAFRDLAVADVKLALYYYLNGQSNFPLFNLALQQALEGNSTLLVPSPEIMISITAALPVICLDEGLDYSWERFHQLASNISKIDTADFGYSQSWQLLLACSAWPIRGRTPKALQIKNPVLFVTADYDLNTPTEWATHQWQQSPNSTLVVRHGDDHGTFDLPGQPAWQMEVDFVRTGILPLPTEQELVSVYAPGSHRPLVQDAYEAPIGPDAGDFLD